MDDILGGLDVVFQPVTDTAIDSGLLSAAASFVSGAVTGSVEAPGWLSQIFGNGAPGQTDMSPADAPLGDTSSAENLLNPQRSNPTSMDNAADMDYSRNGPTPTSDKNDGIISKVQNTVKSWFPEDPKNQAALITMGGSMLANAMKPTPKQIAEAQYAARLKYDRDKMALQQPNFNASGINLGIKPSGIISAVRTK